MKTLVKFSIYLIMMINTKTGSAQQEVSQSSVSNILKLNFFLPGISYEQKISKYQTIYFSSHMGILISKASESANNRAHLFLTPTFNAEVRNYYNMAKRESRGLTAILNNANYIAPIYFGRYSKTSYFSDSEWINQIGAVWGMQRNSPKGFSIDVSFGAVYTFKAKNSSYYNSIEPLLQIKLGFWLGHKSN